MEHSMRAVAVGWPRPRTLGMSWPLIVACIAALVALVGLPPDRMLADGDPYWHLAAGRSIIEQRAVPSVDPFSHSMPGAPWTAHEWLAEVALAGAYAAGGWAGLVFLAAISFAAALAYLTRFLLARMEPVHALLFVAFAGSMLAGHLLARPHVLAWPLLAWWVGTLIEAVERRRAPPWWLLALMVGWANLHGSFTLGILIGAALALEAVLAQERGRRPSAARRWAVFVMLSVCAALATPSGWKGLWFTVHVLANLSYSLTVIGEWHSPNFQEFQAFEVWLLLVLALALGGRMRLHWLRLAVTLGLAHLALKHARNVPIVGLVSPLLFAAPLANQWRVVAAAARDAEGLDRVFRALAAPARPLATAAAVLVVALVIAAQMHAGRRFQPAKAVTPEAALSAALDAGPRGRVLNAYDFGGYLIFRGIPVFVDGRADMYGDVLMKRLMNSLAFGKKGELDALVADYDIEWTLLQPDTPALALLDASPRWRRLYADDIAVVHVRR